MKKLPNERDASNPPNHQEIIFIMHTDRKISKAFYNKRSHQYEPLSRNGYYHSVISWCEENDLLAILPDADALIEQLNKQQTEREG